MKKYILIVFLSCCSANLVVEEVQTAPEEANLTVCEVLEAEYIEFSNELFNTSFELNRFCLLYTSPSPRDLSTSRMPSSA